MTELLPCPFCGGEAETLTAERTDGYIFWVMCQDCCSCVDGYDTEAEAVEAWNARAVFTDCDEAYDAGFNGGVKATLVEFEKWVEEQLEDLREEYAKLKGGEPDD